MNSLNEHYETNIQSAIVVSPEPSKFPPIPWQKIIATVPSGEIRLQQGSDGLWLQFDCECEDALPWCQAQCCALRGIGVRTNERDKLNDFIEWDEGMEGTVMIREADAFCTCLDRITRTCTIYEDRPKTCRDFHCTRGGDVRGWKLPNAVYRQAG